MARKDWIWMPHPGHLIVASECRFHLNTYLGNGYLVSTVGEWLPDAPAREITAQSRGITLEGRGDARRYDYMKKIGFEEIGCDRLYETMVFEASEDKGSCCPWRQASGMELDMDGYNKPEDAYAGHLAMCEKWSKKRK